MASPNSSFPGSEENNENYSSQEQKSLNSQNQVKKTEKHFMSQTVSTASKVTPKKILGERNENSCVESSKDCETNLGCDFRSKNYDSLTNYVSPRPKFLRFDPNRRIEILNRIEKEVNEELSVDFLKLGDGEESSSEDGVNVKVSDETENVVNEEIVDSDFEEGDEEEEFKEEEEERGWCLKGVLKVLFALVACLLSTSYICSMSSSMDLPTPQVVWKFKDGYVMVQNGTLESVDDRLLGTGFLVMKANDSYFESDEVESEGCDNDSYSVDEVVDVGEVDLDGRKEDLVAIDENVANEIDGEVDLDGRKEGLVAIVEKVANEIDEAVEIVFTESGLGFELEKVDDGAYLMENGGEANDADVTEAAEKPDEVLGDGELENEVDSSGETFGVESEMLEKELEEGFTQLEEVVSVKLNSDQEEVLNQLTESDVMELFEERIGSQEKSDNLVNEVDGVMEEQKNEMDSTETGRSSALYVIGLSVMSLLLASVAFFYRSVKVEITSAEKSKPVVEKSTTEHLTTVRKITTVEEHKTVVKELTIEKKIEFLTPTPVTPLINEAYGSNNNSIHVPTVELLGEIFVGSNSFRSGGRKDGVSEVEESNTTRYQDQRPVLSKPVSDPREGEAAETKSVKKQGDKKVKAAIEVTPLRRSGRLRNRAAAMSP